MRLPTQFEELLQILQFCSSRKVVSLNFDAIVSDFCYVCNFVFINVKRIL